MKVHSLQDSEQRLADIKARAHGRWTSILQGIGIPEAMLSGRNQPCPIKGCGGTDRFQYTDKFGEGDYFCRHCGAGGCLKLAQGVLNMSFPELLDAIERSLGLARASSPVAAGSPSGEHMKLLCQKIWQEAHSLQPGDEVDRYFRNRGLQQIRPIRSLRAHPALGYYEKPQGNSRSKLVAEYPALIACVQGPDGRAITLHRTYLKDGCKALGGQSKKVLSSGIDGAAVRLDEATDELAITEGIETGLAVRLSTGKPVWAALNCGNLEKLWVPDTVKRVCIYADNDADGEFSGQVSAYTLAQRLVREAKKAKRELVVQVFVPKPNGADWADVWVARLANEKQAA